MKVHFELVTMREAGISTIVSAELREDDQRAEAAIA